jgi:hypothetical protein
MGIKVLNISKIVPTVTIGAAHYIFYLFTFYKRLLPVKHFQHSEPNLAYVSHYILFRIILFTSNHFQQRMKVRKERTGFGMGNSLINNN